jgi:hypothetical protein
MYCCITRNFSVFKPIQINFQIVTAMYKHAEVLCNCNVKTFSNIEGHL